MSKEERNKAVEEMYPQFVDGFKESIIRYGSTIKSLKEESTPKTLKTKKVSFVNISTFLN